MVDDSAFSQLACKGILNCYNISKNTKKSRESIAQSEVAAARKEKHKNQIYKTYILCLNLFNKEVWKFQYNNLVFLKLPRCEVSFLL